MNSDGHSNDPRNGPPEGRHEAVESQGQTPTAEGAPLITEEGVDEGASKLAEQGREGGDQPER